MKFDDGPPPDAAIAQALSALKREGGSVLVLGAAHACHTDVCERFLGGDAEQVLVRSDGSVHCDVDPAAVVERPVQTRSSAQAAPPDAGTCLDSLHGEVASTLADLSGDGTPIRVCFDSLRPYVDGTPEPELVSFLESLRRTARGTDAVVHVHLPAMPDVVPRSLRDAADAVVELNRRGEATYQQWYLPETDDTSDWVAV
jgi:hypothetical protein